MKNSVFKVVLLLTVVFLMPRLAGAQESAVEDAAQAAAFPAPEEHGSADEAGEAVSFPEYDVYRLPEAEVGAQRDTPERITREEMDRNGVSDLWEAVQYTPGVILSGGGRRNDSNFSVRGFGADSVPVYTDGILMANPYRGEGDSARVLSGDLESIEIQKGYSSELLGANTLGGAIMLRTSKPREPLEASFKSSLGLDSAGKYADSTQVLNLGTKQKYFYGKGVLQYRDVDHYRLSDSFEPFSQNPQEKGDRLWSDSEDLKLTLMAGLTPIPELDIWLSYVYQYADKGYSPPDVKTKEYVIWDWPVWNRYSVSLSSTFSTGPFSIDGLFYFDKYDNRLDEYYNWNSYLLGIHAPHSDYDEYSLGGRLLGSWEILDWISAAGALTYKREDHIGWRGNYSNEELTKETHVNEDTWSTGAEVSLNPWKPLTIKAGYGFDALIPLDYWNQENEFNKLLEADYFIVQTREMFLYTWQFGLFYDINPDHALRLTYARKNHFPTMAQRYSTRFGSTLPNPNLGPEKANHFELGYRGHVELPESFDSAVVLNAAMYYSVISGKIVNIELPNPHYPSVLVDYARNLDETAFWGFELAPEFALKDWLSMGMAFSMNNYILAFSILNTITTSQDGVKVLPYYPQYTLNGYMVIKPLQMLSIIPRIEFIDSRYADTLGVSKLDAYFLAHLKISADIGKYISVSAGIENIFDEYYEISLNSPLAGRSFNFSLAVKY